MPKRFLDKIEVLVVSAQELGPNPENPYDRLTEGERRARFVAVLARLYREWRGALPSPEPIRRVA